MSRIRLKILHISLTEFAVLLLLSLPLPGSAQVRLLDDFETLLGWTPVTSHGDASKLSLTSGPGKTGKAMVMEFSFLGHMGSASAEKKLALPLPPNYQISFDLRADAPVNNFILRLMDTLDNVWIVIRSNYEFPRTWTKFTVRKDQIKYGWGPSGSGELRMLDRMMLMVDVVEGGKGTIWIDNLSIESLDETSGGIPILTASSYGGEKPTFSQDGRIMSGWRSSGKNPQEQLTFDFRHKAFLGGVVIDWDRVDYAGAFDVQLSENGRDWSTAYRVAQAMGRRSSVFLAAGEGRYLRLLLKGGPTGRYGINRLELKGTDFSFSINDFFTAIAADAPRGFYPKYLIPLQSYWTLVGTAGDTREALMNEQGMIESDKLNFSLEPFLAFDGRLTTWNDVAIAQTLEKEYLPIPSVQWETKNGIHLTVKACASGREGESVLFARYTVRNAGSQPAKGKLFVALRPFQVNPPWQTFTIVGGAARVDSIRCGNILEVNQKQVYPITRPQGKGAASFDQGDITEYLKEGIVPPGQVVHDHFGYASAALAYDVSLQPGEQREIVVAIPFHEKHAPLPVNQDDAVASAAFERECSATAGFWESKLNVVSISLPPSAPPLANTIKSNLAYILINADGPALQPGSRSYERSWLRDGALTSVALLQMGIVDEVRRYLDWYAEYQYPDGAIPCIVEPRGPEPTPEHDSHGEFIYAILQYFHFTHDTTWLQGKWDRVAKTVRYIQSLRAQRKTEVYRNGTAEQQALFGLVPESISHEGYCAKPMHSYWDDFFILRGLKDATAIAELLGKTEAAKEFAAERDDFRRDLFASMRMVIQNKHIDYIPSCADLGDLDPTGTTIGVLPGGELGNIPEPQLQNTFDIYYKNFIAKLTDDRNNAFLPYEARAVGVFVMLGQKKRAEELLDFFMNSRRPATWNGWGEIVWKDRNAPKNIGDMPHAWAASDVMRSARSMLVHERESDNALVVGAGIPESWINDQAGLRVEHLPTYYGPLSYSMMRMRDSVIVTLSGPLKIPEGKIIVTSPRAEPVKQVQGDGRKGVAAGEIVVDRLPARVVLVY
jgi:hypothetical protein